MRSSSSGGRSGHADWRAIPLCCWEAITIAGGGGSAAARPSLHRHRCRSSTAALVDKHLSEFASPIHAESMHARCLLVPAILPLLFGSFLCFFFLALRVFFLVGQSGLWGWNWTMIEEQAKQTSFFLGCV
jgi:hypothetical protein